LSRSPLWSIRARLTAWYALVLAAILVVYVAAVFAFQYGLVKRQMYHDEVQDVETVEGLLFFDSTGQLQLQQNYFSHPHSHLLVDRLMEVRDLNGTVLYRSSSLDGQALGGIVQPGEGEDTFNARTIELPDGTRVFVISHRHPVAGRQLLIRLGYSLSAFAARMRQFLMLLIVTMPLALTAAAFAGYGIARKALTPLDVMAARAEQITASNLSERLVIADEKDELGHMARVLNHMLARLEQAFDQLQRFTADVAHELRAPLASLRAAGELAIQRPPDEAGYQEAITHMLEETRHLSQTIDGLLILSRTEAQTTGDTKTAFLLADVVREVLSLFEVIIDERKLAIEEEQAAYMPRQIVSDRGFVRLAIMNVLHNAIKFSPQHSKVTIRYASTLLNDREAEQVCISDSGPGISTADRERLFERFFTSRNPLTAAQSGTGLGLSIAKLTVERCGGRIYFLSSYPNGACCCIEIPLA
jgi:signal transduction histidine kinase